MNRKSKIFLFKSCFVLLATILSLRCTAPLDYEVRDPFRVVPGVRVDGVTLGDSREDVEKLLGNPQDGGIADGLHAAWLATEYSEGSHAGLVIYFREVSGPDGPEAGPVDMIAMRDEYAGTTRDSIGIGVDLSFVREVYGTPLSTTQTSSGTIKDTFCASNKRWFQLFYKDGVVTSMHIGRYLQLPNDLCE